MKIIDLRNTQSHGWVADVLLSPCSIIPVSIPVLECGLSALVEFALQDERHIAYGDPRTPKEVEMDTLSGEWQETYQSLM